MESDRISVVEGAIALLNAHVTVDDIYQYTRTLNLKYRKGVIALLKLLIF
jgi:hypothetical protein